MGLETVELLMDIEDHFGVSIPDEDASRCITVGDTRDVVVRLLVAKGREDSPTLRDEVFHGMVEIIAKQMAMKPEQITPDSTWVGDITTHG